MILLTGASGYLGSAIARELIERRDPFRVLVRDAGRLGFDPGACGCEVALGDLRDPATLALALQGVQSVIHTAALVKMWVRDPVEFRRINIEGLQKLLQAAERAGVQRVVYTSSFLALGPSWNEQASELMRHTKGFSDPYEESKARALDWLRREGESRFPILVTFPGVIYGPGPKTEGNLVGGMIDQYLAGKFPGLLGRGDQRWSFAYIVDVAKAHLTALAKGKPGEEYILGGDNRTLNDFFRVLGDVTHVQRHVRHISFRLARLVAHWELLRARLSGHLPQLTPGAVEIFKHDWVYSSAKAMRELDYRVAPLEEGLRLTLGDQSIR